MDENFYIEGLHEGDESVFKQIFELFHTRLCYFASNLLLFPEGAQDVVQEAFIKLWQKRNDFNSLAAVKSFLYITVKNRCLNIRKHDKVVKKYTDLVQEDKPGEEAINYLLEAEVLERVNTALQKLPEGCRKVIYLSYFEEMRNKEVAEHLKVSINTVKTQKQRGLNILRALMKVTSVFL